VPSKVLPWLLALSLALPAAADPDLLELYQWFHRHPELSKQEKNTSQRLAREIQALGLEVHEHIGGHGLMAILRGQPGGPVVLYRADMDALPVKEATGLPYASEQPGVMHACGHDIHMTVAVATLQRLARAKDQWKGTVVFVGQPAEEVGSGAETMIADPRFSQVLQRAGGPPRSALALHVNASLPVGEVGLTPGYVAANVDSVNIIVHGRGGHGAYPHTAIDPIVIGSEIVMSLQTIVSRKLEPGTRAVITVGKFQSGSKHNIIPPTAELALTLRSYEDEVRRRLLEEIGRTADHVAAAHGAPRPEIQHDADQYTPSLYNDPALVARLRPLLTRQLGPEAVKEIPPTMGGEDFSEYGRRLKIPAVMFSLGVVAPQRVGSGKPLPGLHSDLFIPDAGPSIEIGSRLMAECLLEALKD